MNDSGEPVTYSGDSPTMPAFGPQIEIRSSLDAQLREAATIPPRAKRTGITRCHPPATSFREVIEQVYHSNSRNEYEYSKLNSKDEIRLLLLQPGQGSDMIECGLISTKLGPETQRYEALSYHWGPCEPKYEIRINSYRPGADQPSLRHFTRQRFYILGELHSALRCLRDPHKSLVFWVDALCINGDDREELNNQVSMMTDIFNRASNVCIWLGESNQRSSMAMSLIPQILDLVNLDDLLRANTTLELLQAFLELTARPWFSRLWVIQEIACARNASIHCGKDSVHWADFADAVALLSFKTKEMALLFKSSTVGFGLPNDLTEQTLDVTELVKVTREIIRLSENGDIVERLWDLETLVSNLSRFRVTVPHDRVYAVLGLARDCQPSVGNFPKIGYTKNFSDVCREFVDYCVKRSGSLDILCRPWLSCLGFNMPSWASPRYMSSSEMEPMPESLVGLPGRKIYNASNSTAAVASFDGLSLAVRGFRLDRISTLSSSGARICISPTSLSMGGWLDLKGIETPTIVPDKLWRTLVADRGPNGTSPPSWYHRACLYLLTRCTCPDGGIDVRNLLMSGRPATAIEFLKRVESVIWDRQFLLTARDKFFGLAPATARLGDLVCIIYGCSVPVVLREHTNKRARDGPDAPAGCGSHFEFIGECYIHGMMNGQAVEVSKGHPPDEVFTIR